MVNLLQPGSAYGLGLFLRNFFMVSRKMKDSNSKTELKGRRWFLKEFFKHKRDNKVEDGNDTVDTNDPQHSYNKTVDGVLNRMDEKQLAKLYETDENTVQSIDGIELSIEDEAAHLALQVNQIIVRPYLHQAYDYLVNSKKEAEAAYHNILGKISFEIESIYETNRVLQENIDRSKRKMLEKQAVIKKRYNEATEIEISSGSLNLDGDYNEVAENYERSMHLRQELIKNKMRIESLNETSDMLNSSISLRIKEIQSEVDKLSELLSNLRNIEYPEQPKHDGQESSSNAKSGDQQPLLKIVEGLNSNSYAQVVSSDLYKSDLLNQEDLLSTRNFHSAHKTVDNEQINHLYVYKDKQGKR